jgi:anti-sigma B factor antagonist
VVPKDQVMDVEQAVRATSDAVRVQGEMTIYRANEVAQTLFDAIRAHDGDVSLDLSAVTEFDTAGLQLVLMARRLAETSGRRLDLVQPSECVVEVLDLCHVAVSVGSQQQAGS